MTEQNDPADSTKGQPLIEHLIELRSRLLKIAGFVLVIFIKYVPEVLISRAAHAHFWIFPGIFWNFPAGFFFPYNTVALNCTALTHVFVLVTSVAPRMLTLVLMECHTLRESL